MTLLMTKMLKTAPHALSFSLGRLPACIETKIFENLCQLCVETRCDRIPEMCSSVTVASSQIRANYAKRQQLFG